MDNEYKTLPEQPDGGNVGKDNSVPTQNNYAGCHNMKMPEPPEWTKNIVIAPTPWDIPPVGEEQNTPVIQSSDTDYANQQEPDADESPKNMPMAIQIGIIVLGVIIVALLFNYVTGINKDEEEIETTPSFSVSESTTVIPVIQSTTTTATQPSTTEEAVLSSDEDETEKPTENKTDKKTETTKNAENDKNVSSSEAQTTQPNELTVKKEVLKYFNESINRVKPEAVKIVKNFENRTHNSEMLELPGVIKSIAKKMLDDNLSNVVEPVEYATAEEITARFPVSGESWSSQLTTDDVKEAICVDLGSEYEITLKLYDTVDPEPGKGAAKAMECINVPEVAGTAPEFITSFSAEYYDCVIKCRADKATGRIIWANYTTPVVVKMKLDPGFTQAFDAQIGLTFEKDYTIIY